MIATSNGIPAEFTFTTGKVHDKQMPVNLIKNIQILTDTAYTDYTVDEML